MKQGLALQFHAFMQPALVVFEKCIEKTGIKGNLLISYKTKDSKIILKSIKTELSNSAQEKKRIVKQCRVQVKKAVNNYYDNLFHKGKKVVYNTFDNKSFTLTAQFLPYKNIVLKDTEGKFLLKVDTYSHVETGKIIRH